MNEIERIKYAYHKRELEGRGKDWIPINKACFYSWRQRDYAVIEALKNNGFSELDNARVLNVGCGEGQILREFIKYGARPQNLYGVDLLENKIKNARYLAPNIDFMCVNAEELLFPDESFDIVTQFTVFTSILYSQMKENVARQMLRVLKREGIILWYDYFVDNPQNPDVRGVRKKDIYDLFSARIVKFI